MTPSATVADKAINWVCSNVSHFSPFQPTKPFDEQRLKALCELAFLCWLILRESRSAGDSRLWSCLDLIRETYNNHSFSDKLYREPETFVAYLLIAVALHKTGLLPAEDLRIFQTLIDHSNVLFSERPAHRRLELRYIFDVAGFTHRLPSYDALYRASITSNTVNPIYITDLDAYSITHTLFYCADFGAHTVGGVPLRRLRHGHNTVKTLLGMYTIRPNWDLVAELLVSCHCLQETSSMIYALAWKALTQAQWESGAVPGPFHDRDKERALPDHEKQDYIFRQCYHTTLVAALAGALCAWKECP
jgi:hypothetical protein